MKWHWLHPFLINAYFVLHWYQRTYETNSWRLLGGSMLAVLGTTALLLLAPRRFFRDSSRLCLLVSLFSVWFWTFGYIWSWVYRMLVDASLIEHIRMRYFFVLQCALLVGIGIWLVRVRRGLETLDRYLGVTGILVLLSVCFQIVERTRRNAAQPHTPRIVETALVRREPATTQKKPDIYLIVLDMYTSLDSLQRHWGYSSSAFREFLHRKGFTVAENARSNYDFTGLSVCSMLDMDYPAVSPEGSFPARMVQLRDRIQSARFVQFLKEQDYDVVNLSAFDLDARQKRFEIDFLPDRASWRTLIRTTPAKLMLDAAVTVPAVMREIETVAGAAIARPKFVYAHIMLPHNPYVFDRHGRRAIPVLDGADRTAYLEQLRFTEIILQDTLESVLKLSPTRPVVILQGDHGFRNLPGTFGAAESVSCLQAMLLPGRDEELGRDGLTPVNVFRLVSNLYFDQALPYLTNRFFVSSTKGFVAGALKELTEPELNELAKTSPSK